MNPVMFEVVGWWVNPVMFEVIGWWVNPVMFEVGVLHTSQWREALAICLKLWCGLSTVCACKLSNFLLSIPFIAQ